MSTVTHLNRLYRPSNSTEGEFFMDQFCRRCTKFPRTENDDGCDILSRSFWNDINDREYPKEWIQDGDGENPRCTAFKARE